MSDSDGFSVRAILRARARLGPRAALALARARAETLPPGDDRRRVLEVALESAFLAGDEETLLALARAWSHERSARPSDVVLALVLELRARRSPHAALALSRAEFARCESGAVLVALAAAAEEAGVLAQTKEALRAALAGTDAGAAHRALLELLRLALAEGAVEDDLLRRAIALVREPMPGLDARDRLLVAAAALRSQSRYDRALALDELVRVAREREPGAAARALRLGLEHADRHGARLSALELERVVVLVSAALPEGSPRAALERELAARATPSGSPERLVLAGVDPVRRARAVLAGGEPGPGPAVGEAHDEWRALRALAAIRAGRDAEASLMLDAEVHEPRSAPAWWMVVVLGAERPSLGARVERTVAHLIARGVPSPRPLPEIAARLETLGHEGPALAVLRLAVAHGESRAHALLVEALVRAGWRAAHAGEAERAIALLREAKERAGG